MFIHELQFLKNEEKEIKEKIINLKKRTLKEILIKINKNEEYKKYFFLNNWQLMFLCACLPNGDSVYNEAEDGENWEPIYELINQKEITDLLPSNIDEFENLIFFKNNNYEDKINVLNESSDIGDYFCGIYYYKFDDEFKEITKVFFQINEDECEELNNENIKIIMDILNECKQCQYYTVCDKRNKECKKKLI